MATVKDSELQWYKTYPDIGFDKRTRCGMCGREFWYNRNQMPILFPLICDQCSARIAFKLEQSKIWNATREDPCTICGQTVVRSVRAKRPAICIECSGVLNGVPQRPARTWELVRLTHCGMCGSEHWWIPGKDPLLPAICGDCGSKHTEALERLGLLWKQRRDFCIHCGKQVIRNRSATKEPECRTCTEKIRRRQREENVNREVRDRRFNRACALLRRQPNRDDYIKPLALIQRKLYEPGWWDSSLEILVAAELMRRGHKVKPQQPIGLSDHRVDLLVTDVKLVVEIDGELYHAGQQRKRKDRSEIGQALLHGYAIARLSEREIMENLIQAVNQAEDAARTRRAYFGELQYIADRKEQKRYLWRILRDLNVSSRDEIAFYLGLDR